jgi:5'-nucleotidase
MRKLSPLILTIFIATVYSCSAPQTITGSKDNGSIDIQFLQINDVYEIAPIEAGKIGGIARVAQVKKELRRKNPNTYLIMAGDFLSPSVYNSLNYQGKRIRGRQMVDALNTAGLDIAVFGNHEFDISESELQNRLDESAFEWVSSNSFHKTSEGISAFVRRNNSVPSTLIKTYTDADGTTVNIGFMGINIPFNKAPYVSYTDPLETAERMFNILKDKCDAVIAITHQLEEDDIALAKKLPQLALIMGGHEHDMRYDKVGPVIISKAHANARSAYILNLHINKKAGTRKITSSLKMLDQQVGLDTATDIVVQTWSKIARDNYASIGFDAEKIVVKSGTPLDAREATVRAGKTNFTRLLVNAMEAAAPDATVAVVNAGSIRLDDQLQAPITQYDILRTMPFGGAILEAKLPGRMLKQVLDAGVKNIRTGGFLHFSETLQYDAINNTWKFKNQPLDDNMIFRVAMSDFLLTGGEANLGFLKTTNPDIEVYPVVTSKTDPRYDIRAAVIRYLEKLNP